MSVLPWGVGLGCTSGLVHAAHIQLALEAHPGTTWFVLQPQKDWNRVEHPAHILQAVPTSMQPLASAATAIVPTQLCLALCKDSAEPQHWVPPVLFILHLLPAALIVVFCSSSQATGQAVYGSAGVAALVLPGVTIWGRRLGLSYAVAECSNQTQRLTQQLHCSAHTFVIRTTTAAARQLRFFRPVSPYSTLITKSRSCLSCLYVSGTHTAVALSAWPGIFRNHTDCLRQVHLQPLHQLSRLTSTVRLNFPGRLWWVQCLPLSLVLYCFHLLCCGIHL
jgi:hypothetical protein